MFNVTDLSWVEEEKIYPRMLLLSRRIESIVDGLERQISNPINRILLGVEHQEPKQSDDIQSDILISQAWLASGHSLDEEFARQLEEIFKN